MKSNREHDHAVLHACRATEWGLDEKMRLLTIMDSYRLRPIALIHDGVQGEDNALTHQEHLSSLNESKPDVLATPPRKRRREESGAATTMEASLYSAFVTGPYRKQLLQQTYCELNDSMAQFLNDDWSIHCKVSSPTKH